MIPLNEEVARISAAGVAAAVGAGAAERAAVAVEAGSAGGATVAVAVEAGSAGGAAVTVEGNRSRISRRI